MTLVVGICGATAVGKSGLAHALARHYQSAILAADSATIYRGIDIGTAKPSSQERKEVSYYLLDERDLSEQFSTGDFVRRANEVIESLAGEGKPIFVVGGSGFYLRSLLDGLVMPPVVEDASIRDRLQRLSLPELSALLLEKDPKAHEQIDTKNPRRLIRALEVIEATSKKFSDFGHCVEPSFEVLKFSLERSLEDLKERIYQRTKGMIEQGWIEEVRALLPLRSDLQGRNILGYDEVLSFIDGELTRQELEGAIAIRTFRFAKRQRTWFAKEKNLQRFTLGREENSTALIEELVGLIDRKRSAWQEEDDG